MCAIHIVPRNIDYIYIYCMYVCMYKQHIFNTHDWHTDSHMVCYGLLRAELRNIMRMCINSIYVVCKLYGACDVVGISCIRNPLSLPLSVGRSLKTTARNCACTRSCSRSEIVVAAADAIGDRVMMMWWSCHRQLLPLAVVTTPLSAAAAVASSTNDASNANRRRRQRSPNHPPTAVRRCDRLGQTV